MRNIFEELARREAFLQGRKEQLLSEEKERKDGWDSVNIFMEEGGHFPSFFNSAGGSRSDQIPVGHVFSSILN